ncbi:uncharacterized protein LOC110454828 isoform X2 [Mizuhopecten yessoensis]|uniref:uncharacterized protein LOC110454828 isoform X2 n=1 Tax=Mizuhopecten yessoensis TaxID=6573 RepID=UPI000B45A677|nr:uncharacterized protein LOC110454828 isoform X2 [Mizuhopecten yessoensis]
MLSRSLLVSRQIVKSANVQSVRHGSASLREIAVKHHNDLDALPIPHGCWKTDFKAKDTKYNINIALLLVLNFATYGFIKKVCPGTDARARPTTFKVDPPIFNTYDE